MTKEYLSEGQKALYFLHKLNPESKAYHIVRAFTITKPVQKDKLSKAFEKLVTRHSNLCSRFILEDGIPYRYVDIEHKPKIIYQTASDWSENRLKEKIKNFSEVPFVLSEEPPFRVFIFDRTPVVLLFIFHHIIADLWSLAILLKEFGKLYQAEYLDEETDLALSHFSPTGFAEFENELLQSKPGRAMRDFWLSKVKDFIPIHQAHIDFPHMNVAKGSGIVYRQILTKETFNLIEANKNYSPYVILLSAFHVLINKYTGNDQISIGSLMPNRSNPRFRNTVAYLANLIVTTSEFFKETTFSDLLDYFRRSAIGYMRNQAFPFSKLIESLDIERTYDTSHIIQYAFNYYGVKDEWIQHLAAIAFELEEEEIQTGILNIKPYSSGLWSSQFDVNLNAALVGGKMVLLWEANAERYQIETIQRMAQHFELLLQKALKNPATVVRELSITTPEEKKIIREWNQTECHFKNFHHLESIFNNSAEKFSDHIAIFDEKEQYTYSQLNEKSARIADFLTVLGVCRGDTVAVLMPRSLQMIFSIFGIVKAGAVYLPIDTGLPETRIRFILEEIEPKMLFTERLEMFLSIQPTGIRVVEKKELTTILDYNSFGETHNEKIKNLQPSDIAYMLYTSGSSGIPKAAMISHKAICNRILWMQNEFGFTSSDTFIQKTSTSFDVSLWEIFCPMLSGASLMVIPEKKHLDIAYLAEVIQNRKITVIHFIPSILSAFLDLEQAKILPALRYIVCSGETLSKDVAVRCTKTLPHILLYNLYGPTEAAVDVSYWQYQKREDERIPIGRPIANTRLYILDDQLKILPIGIIGELFIGGVALAEGYFKRIALSAQNFILHPDLNEKLYKTGDLAKLLPDGNIEFIGRTDNQVKIRGIRIELEEIESIIQREFLLNNAVIWKPKHKKNQLIAYYERPKNSINKRLQYEFEEKLSHLIPSYMIPSLFIEAPVLPRLNNGKINRIALQSMDVPATEINHPNPIPLSGETEWVIGEAIMATLDISQVFAADNFFQLGGDSIRGLTVLAYLSNKGWILPLEELYSNKTIHELAKTLKKKHAGPIIKFKPFDLITHDISKQLPDDVENAYPLSKIQEGLVFHSRFSVDYEVYVMGLFVSIVFDPDAIKEVLSYLVRKYQVLRTSYELTKYGKAIQLVHRIAEIPVEVIDISKLSFQEQNLVIKRFMQEERFRFFDWGKAPLIRLIVHKRGASKYQFTFAHPLFDGWSITLLITEFFSLYHAWLLNKTLPVLHPLPIQIYDFIALERQTILSKNIQDFWRKRIKLFGRCPLPQYSSNEANSYSRHTRIPITIAKSTSDQLIAMANDLHIPLKSILLAAHLKVVASMTNTTMVTTGLITNGRPETEGGDEMIGMFLNTVPFGIKMEEGTWIDLFEKVLETEQEIIPYRRYPLSEMIRLFGERQPIFETAFNFINFHAYEKLNVIPDFEIFDWYNLSDQTYFPLTVYFHLDILSSRLLLFLDIDESLFKPKQIEYIQAYYTNALLSICNNPKASYIRECILSEDEKTTVTRVWNHTHAQNDFEKKLIHEQIISNAQRNPKDIAIIGVDGILTYQDLENESQCIAGFLQQADIKPGSVIAFLLRRTTLLPTTLLGIMRAGYVYLPLDISFPEERIQFILEDAQAALLITEEELKERLSTNFSFPIVLIEDIISLRNDSLDKNLIERVMLDKEDLVYIIYTSGSSGYPKGVKIPHRALVNLILAFGEILNFKHSDKLLAITTISFDIAALEIFLPLCQGSCLVLAKDQMVLDGYAVKHLIENEKISCMQATPSVWQVLMNTDWQAQPGFKAITGGEKLSRKLADEIKDRGCILINAYGPTETTIWSTYSLINYDDDIPPIGQPIRNTQMYILDEYLNPVPIGVKGEIYIGGDGVSTGYLNNEILTKSKFVPNIFNTSKNELLFKTGDIGRWRLDGQIEFLTRNDRQVKLRGFRIELGEIQECINNIDTVVNSAVLIKEKNGEEKHLAAYIVLSGEEKLSPKQIRNKLKGFLPQYMIPGEIYFLNELPVTHSGKVNYQQLETLPHEQEINSSISKPPVTTLEKAIADIYKKVLHVDQLSIDDNFFDLGGHSLLMIHLHYLLEEKLNRKFPIVNLFEYPTVQKLADFLNSMESAIKPNYAPDKEPNRGKRLFLHKKRLEDSNPEE